MAADLALFLWDESLTALREAETELSLLTLTSHFLELKSVMENTDHHKICASTPFETRDLLYKLNDLLAECRIFALQRKELNKNLLRFNILAEIYFLRTKRKQLRGVKEGLEKIVEKRKEEAELCPPIWFPTARQTYPEVNASEIIGFDSDQKKIEELLSGSGDVGFKAIGIVGVCGTGKTSLAQLVFNSPTVQNNFFPRIWVSLSDSLVSDNEVNIGVKIVKYILEVLGCDVDEWPRGVGIVKLLRILHCLLLGKKYLIVLDDVWRIDEWYEDLCYKLPEGDRIKNRFSHGLPKGSGGLVIVTSRLEEVAKRMVGKNNLLHLEGSLGEESCWQLLTEIVDKDGTITSKNHILSKIKKEIKDQCHGLPLAVRTLAEVIPLKILESNLFLKEFYIPDYMLVPDMEVETNVDIAKYPVLVLIDTETAGQLGGKLLVTFRSLLNGYQVFDLLEENPAKVLHKVYGTLEKLKHRGYDFASQIQKRLKIIVVGRDAVTNWLLEIICDLKLPESPSIALVPQGSEIIPISFGWGKQNLNGDRQSVTSFLDQVTKAKEMKIDSWHIFVRKKANTPDSVAHLEMPQSLHMFTPIHPTEVQNTDNYVTFRGGFWNYVSMGIDAQGWHVTSCFYPSSWTKYMLANVRVRKQNGHWQDLYIPSSIRSIVCLNLPSFPGGRNPWGTPNTRTRRDRDLTPPYIDDGLLEVIGFRDVLIAQSGRWIRLGQVSRIRFEFKKGAAEFLNMSIDGTPPKQIPLDDNIEIEISHFGQVKMLVTSDCQVKSMHDPTLGASDEDDSTEEEDPGKYFKVQRKFGAADTFKILDDSDATTGVA